MTIEKDFAGRQTVGARRTQEDAYAFSEIAGADGAEGLLVVLADGMGGHCFGEMASEMAVKSFVSAFHENQGDIGKRLDTALHAANEALADHVRRERAQEGMGTTLVAACVTQRGLEWISVGDSPLYLWRENKLSRVNADHSMRPVLQELAEQGAISSPVHGPSRNILRAALTGDEIEMIDRSTTPTALQRGDIVLLATDGIDSLSDDEIGSVTAEFADAPASAVAENLLNALLRAGNPKQDNTTVALVKAAAANTPAT